MYRILLVDDEEHTLEGLRHGVPFEKMGFEKVFTACNAVAARQLLLTEPVDIMLCDIEMPGESGLELLQWVKEYQLPVVTIILTCHADFEYSRSALKLGSLDYILKPVAYEEVEEAVRRGIEKVRLITRERDAHTREKLFIKGRKHLVEKLWKEILSGELTVSEKLLEELYSYNGMEFEKEAGYRIFLIDLLFMHEDVEAQDDGNVRFAIWNMAEEILIRKQGWAFFQENEILIGILRERKEMPLAEALRREEALKGSFREFFRICKQHLECYFNVFYSPVIPMEEIREQYQTLWEKAKQQVIKKEMIVRGDEELTVYRKEFPLPDLERWIGLFKTGSEQEILEELRSFVRRNATEESLNNGILEQCTGACMQAAYACVTEWKIGTDFLLGKEMQSEIHNACRSVERYEAFAAMLVHTLCEKRRNIYQKKRKLISDRAKEYIGEHLDERLLSEQIAQFLFLNVDYLNRIFKKETGITLSEYISSQRIEKAKELLLTSSLSVSEIALEVGFQSFSYFSKIFKKKTGMEPLKYRKDEKT